MGMEKVSRAKGNQWHSDSPFIYLNCYFLHFAAKKFYWAIFPIFK